MSYSPLVPELECNSFEIVRPSVESPPPPAKLTRFDLIFIGIVLVLFYGYMTWQTIDY